MMDWSEGDDKNCFRAPLKQESVLKWCEWECGISSLGGKFCEIINNFILNYFWMTTFSIHCFHNVITFAISFKDITYKCPLQEKGRANWNYNGICAFSNKLLSLLNLLCNSTQNSSVTVRDACYGCFFRVGVLPPGASLLNQLSQCANIYLMNTSYAGCSSQLSVSF